MPKQYQYFIVFSEQGTQVINTHIEKTFDHQITFADIKAIETKLYDPIDLFFHSRQWIVTDYKLLSVTGTFTYNVTLWEYPEYGGKPFMGSMVRSLDHQITEKTIKADFEQLETLFFEDDESVHINSVRIISFQEIPDE